MILSKHKSDDIPVLAVPRTARIKKLLLNSSGSSHPVSLICQSLSGLQDCTLAVVCVMATWPFPFTQDRSSMLLTSSEAFPGSHLTILY